MGRQFDVHLAFPTGDAYLFILTRTWALLITARFCSRELINGFPFSDILPLSLVNTLISVGLLYIHLRPKAVLALG